MKKQNFPRILSQLRLFGQDCRRCWAVQKNSHTRLQGKPTILRRVLCTHRRTIRLGKAELKRLGSPSVTGLLVEDKIRRLEMNRILELFRGRLIWIIDPLGIRLKINGSVPLASNVAGLLVVIESFSVDLIEARGIAPIDGNRHIVQFG